MDHTLLSPEQQEQWRKFEMEQKRRLGVISRLVKILGLKPLDLTTSKNAVCPTCGFNTRSMIGNSLYEDADRNYYKAIEIYEAIIKRFGDQEITEVSSEK